MAQEENLNMASQSDMFEINPEFKILYLENEIKKQKLKKNFFCPNPIIPWVTHERVRRAKSKNFFHYLANGILK